MVIDEVLAVGDADFQKKCIAKMKDVSNNGRTVLFVSHNMTSIRNLCSKCVLENGQIMYNGSSDEAISFILTRKEADLKNNMRNRFKVNNSTFRRGRNLKLHTFQNSE